MATVKKVAMNVHLQAVKFRESVSSSPGGVSEGSRGAPVTSVGNEEERGI